MRHIAIKPKSSHKSHSRADEAVTKLRQIAKVSGPDSKLPTVRDLCQMLQVSSVTLDAALSEMEDQELIYRRHAVGIFVSPKIWRRDIHVILNADNFLNPGFSPVWAQIWASLMQRAEVRTQDNNEAFTFHLANTVQRDGPIRDFFLSELEENRIHAVIGIGLPLEFVDEINAFGVPVIGFSGAGNHYVAPDMREAIPEAVDHLISRGCRTIGYWRTGPVDSEANFSFLDVLDGPKLVRRMRDPDDAVPHYLAALCPPDTARRIAEYQDGAPLSDAFLRDLCEVLNTAIWRTEPLWNDGRFAHVLLREETKRAMATGAQGPPLQPFLHRLLLQDAFRNEIVQDRRSDPEEIGVFRRALRSRGMTWNPDLVQIGSVEPDNPLSAQAQVQGYALAMNVYGKPNGQRPDALLIEDDMMTSGAHTGLDEIGLELGKDIWIATHANAGTPTLFPLRGREIRMEFDPAEFVAAIFRLMDQNTSRDIERPTWEHVKPRLVIPAERTESRK